MFFFFFFLMLRIAFQHQRAKDKTVKQLQTIISASLIGPRHTEDVMKGAQYTLHSWKMRKRNYPEAKAQTATNSKVLPKETAINLEFRKSY